MVLVENKFSSFCLEFSNVGFQRGNRFLFSNLSFDLKSGQVLWIQGDNGIGKTSILKLALGLWTPNEGTVNLINNSEIGYPGELCTYLGHSAAFEPSLTASEALGFWKDILQSPSAVSMILEKVGLENQGDVRISALSAGQKKRLALARILLTERPIWVMDEPKSAMDKDGQELVDKMIGDHLASGGAALIASHDKSLPIGKSSRRLVLEAER